MKDESLRARRKLGDGHDGYDTYERIRCGERFQRSYDTMLFLVQRAAFRKLSREIRNMNESIYTVAVKMGIRWNRLADFLDAAEQKPLSALIVTQVAWYLSENYGLDWYYQGLADLKKEIEDSNLKNNT